MAEVKTLKFGEPLPGNADGNPEPSLNDNIVNEGVETRQGLCLKCSCTLTKPRQKKFCSTRCSTAFGMQQYRIRRGLIEKPGAGSGGNQAGSKNSQWVDGWTTYRKKAAEAKPRKCERCDAQDKLLVHHKDHNRRNSELNNLEVLCKGCHQKHHAVRGVDGRFVKTRHNA